MRALGIFVSLTLLGLATILVCAACTVERFFVLNETINYPTWGRVAI